MTIAIIILAGLCLFLLFKWMSAQTSLMVAREMWETWKSCAENYKTHHDAMRVERDKALQKLRKIEQLTKQ